MQLKAQRETAERERERRKEKETRTQKKEGTQRTQRSGRAVDGSLWGLGFLQFDVSRLFSSGFGGVGLKGSDFGGGCGVSVDRGVPGFSGRLGFRV